MITRAMTCHQRSSSSHEWLYCKRMSSGSWDRTALVAHAGDVIYTNTDLNVTGQYFWEAFPAGSGPADRTTYLFTYIDADPRRCGGTVGYRQTVDPARLNLKMLEILRETLCRPSLEALMEEYWRLMPDYQGVRSEDLQPLRILFGYFPTYRGSPLPPAWDRILQAPRRRSRPQCVTLQSERHTESCVLSFHC